MPGTGIIYYEIVLLIFLVAALYSSVGHGGASGYLAVLSLCAIPRDEMKATALVLNVLVAGIASIAFIRSGHFKWRLTWPFILASIPAAYFGGRWHVSEHVYGLLLGLALLVAAGRLLNLLAPTDSANEPQTLRLTAALPVGAGIGGLSGLIGIGGGIFLSPILLFTRWATVKETAATSAVFIVVNSLAGLCGNFTRHQFSLTPFLPIIAAALCGGLVGSYLGARHSSPQLLQRLLAAVLLLAAGKLLLGII